MFFNFISGKFRFSLFKISARKWTGLSCYGLALCARYFFFFYRYCARYFKLQLNQNKYGLYIIYSYYCCYFDLHPSGKRDLLCEHENELPHIQTSASAIEGRCLLHQCKKVFVSKKLRGLLAS